MAGVTGIRYVRYLAPDLDLMERFLTDFGLTRSSRTPSALYMRGTGSEHHIHVTELGENSGPVGVGLRVDSLEDLKAIATRAGVKTEPSDEPGGGVRAVLTDPNGMRVDLLYGQDNVDPLPVREPLVMNDSKCAKRLGSFQRPPRGASHISRVEHAVLEGPNYTAAKDFYCDLLGMEMSDSLYTNDPADTVVAFLHCGLGSAYTDHHTIALAQAPQAGFHHSAFVTLDWDDLMLGHYHLKSQGYSHDWGIGRHIMGSEVFDYWRDPFGNRVEHCNDGDMVNDEHEADNVPLEEDVLAIWSPAPSEDLMPSS
ncbi:VOC family protein [Sphingobium subterraneum]|uniref:Catechol 2,3-dioxygenase-like lactoylglutathione lyase family enzyme n=1 Tax=Sphingobium subterraneum TaxID=627688 RepID=A0A841J9P8_9SPHN|nr:VOC family protein [Sphingobium subterraneum]MBB6125225.1 catechol 2,3-dioxygenase-like lactoylglutathione lyase family enzyme [Sphingobium subterraneum]